MKLNPVCVVILAKGNGTGEEWDEEMKVRNR